MRIDEALSFTCVNVVWLLPKELGSTGNVFSSTSAGRLSTAVTVRRLELLSLNPADGPSEMSRLLFLVLQSDEDNLRIRVRPNFFRSFDFMVASHTLFERAFMIAMH
mmetsp:Transcript_2219/g.4999  ORF Transcript_2219/g.4999 Transcript_2219/m.4999 type:complete len:107 (+) Transcript_2219:2350-2670(+)